MTTPPLPFYMRNAFALPLSGVMGVIDRFITSFELDPSKYESGMRKVVRSTEEFQRADKAAKVQMVANAEAKALALDRLSSRANTAGNALVGLGAAGIALDARAIRASAAFERQKETMTALGKSASFAQKELAYLDARASKSSFNLTELVQADKLLTAYGLNGRKFLIDSEDLAAGMGQKVDDVARVFGRLKAGDFADAFERLRDFGISRELLEGQGLKFDKNNSYQGSVDQALTGVQRIIQDKFGGLSEKLASSTFSGALSNMEDSIGRFERKLGDRALPLATKAVRGLTGALDGLTERINPAGAAAILLAGPLAGIAGGALKAYFAIRGMSYLQKIAKNTSEGLGSALDTGNTVLETGNKLLDKRASLLGALGKLGVAALGLGVVAGLEYGGNAAKEAVGIRNFSGQDYAWGIGKRGLQGAAAGATIGALGGLPGMAIGGVVGGILGLGAGAIENFGSAYKYGQDARGANREADKGLADFNKARREGKGREYLRGRNDGLTPRETLQAEAKGLDPATLTAGLKNGGLSEEDIDKQLRGLAAGDDRLVKQVLGGIQTGVGQMGKVEANTRRTADNTRKAVDFSRLIVGGGELARLGVAPVEFAGFKSGGGAGGGAVKIDVTGAKSFEDIIMATIVGLKRQRAF